MIKSMTGFGRCELSKGDRKVTVEMKSVNHRYLEMGIKVPKKLNFLESDIRNQIKNSLSRGKVDVFITYENLGEGSESIRYNLALAKEYYDAYEKISQELNIENDVKSSYIMRSPDVISIESGDDDEDVIKSLVLETVQKATDKLIEARLKDGLNIQEDLINKLDNIAEIAKFIEDKSPIIVEEYKEKITSKIHELLEDNQIDEARIIQEVTVFADKVCVDEEIVRLNSHVQSMREAMINGGENIGRSLDFIAQEMNREANTTLSKTSDAEVSNRAIELKTEIEKVREQIQNIE